MDPGGRWRGLPSGPSLRHLTDPSYGVPPEQQKAALQELTRAHVESFNYAVREGLSHAVQVRGGLPAPGLRPAELAVPGDLGGSGRTAREREVRAAPGRPGRGRGAAARHVRLAVRRTRRRLPPAAVPLTGEGGFGVSGLSRGGEPWLLVGRFLGAGGAERCPPGGAFHHSRRTRLPNPGFCKSASKGLS